MKKQVSLLLIIFFTIVYAHAQKNNGERNEKIKLMKIGLITEELALSEQQAAKFWPIYNSHAEERKLILKEIRERSKMKTAGDETSENIIKNQDMILELKQKDIILTKKYRDSYLKVITALQYAKLIESEKKFNEMILQKLKERRAEKGK